MDHSWLLGGHLMDIFGAQIDQRKDMRSRRQGSIPINIYLRIGGWSLYEFFVFISEFECFSDNNVCGWAAGCIPHRCWIINLGRSRRIWNSGFQRGRG